MKIFLCSPREEYGSKRATAAPFPGGDPFHTGPRSLERDGYILIEKCERKLARMEQNCVNEAQNAGQAVCD